MSESVELTVKAFSDSSYSNFYSQANFTVDFHFIDITAISWATLLYDNFDDGTTQGWQRGEDGFSMNVASYSYYRSWPNSLRFSRD